MIKPVNYKVTTPPASEPITLLEAKGQAKVTTSMEDELITSMIQVAREWCEKYQHRAYITQTVTAHYAKFGDMVLPLNPVKSIDSIQYIDTDGVLQLLPADIYKLDSYSEPSFIYKAYDQVWPSVRNEPNCIKVIYTAGYDVVPESVKHAMKLIVAHLYEHREENSEVALSTLPFGTVNLLGDRMF